MCHNGFVGTGNKMICDNCGKEGARVRRVARTYGKGRNIFVIENVPVVSCPHCGESYLDAETLHEIERIRLHKRSLAVRRSISVVDFA
jgi:YgiT-type zinc finger domain-containing protein